MSKLQKLFEKLPRRTKYELWAECLELCLYESRTQTWLLHEMRIKTSAIKEILDFLTSRDLLLKTIVENEEYSNYRTTDKGKEALHEVYYLFEEIFKI